MGLEDEFDLRTDGDTFSPAVLTHRYRLQFATWAEVIHTVTFFKLGGGACLCYLTL